MRIGRDSEAIQPSYHVRIRPRTGWAAINLRELWLYRDLLLILMVRDIKLRYKQTALGVTWVILQPLVAALIFSVIFGRFASLPSGDSPYLLIAFSGVLAWNLFSGSLQRAGGSLVEDAKLISKVYFPRMIVPIASSAAVLADHLVTLAVMLGLMVLFGVPFRWNLVVVPGLTLITFLLSVGVSLFFSALSVYYRDFMYALPFLIQVWMYASPVVYTLEIVPESLRTIYAINPLVGVIQAFRWAFLATGEFPWRPLSISLASAAVLLLSGSTVFRRVERSFADVV